MKINTSVKKGKSEIFDLLVDLREALGEAIPARLEKRYDFVIENYNEIVRNEIDIVARDTVQTRYNHDSEIDAILTKEE